MAGMTVTEVVQSPEAGIPTIPTIPTVRTVRTVRIVTTVVFEPGRLPAADRPSGSAVILEQEAAPAAPSPSGTTVAPQPECRSAPPHRCGCNVVLRPTGSQRTPTRSGLDTTGGGTAEAAVDTRHRTAALTGLGLVAVSLSLRALLYRHLDPAAPAPDLLVGGWSIAAALFPHGNVGAAAFVAQATILAAGLSAALQTNWFTELDAAGRRGAVALAVAGGLSLVPVVALALVIAANVVAVALLLAGAVLVLRAVV